MNEGISSSINALSLVPSGYMDYYNAILDTFSQPWMDQVYFGNSVRAYILAGVVFIVLYLFFQLVLPLLVKIFTKVSSKTKWQIDDMIAAYLNGVYGIVWILLSLFIALSFLTFPSPFEQVPGAAVFIIVVALLIRLVQKVSSYALATHVPAMRGGGDETSLPSFLEICIAIGLWSLGLLLVLSNLGVDVTSLIAGLGIGGIAVALALQNILGDMFSSFSIYFDKPFKVGDFIIVGEHKGTVKKIGLKSTRIQALQGEEVVISNQELTSARIQNFKKMPRRRVVFSFGVLYSTTEKQLKKIPDIVQKAVETEEGATFDRAHFFSFGDSSLDFEAVYYVDSSDYTQYMNIQQNVNMALFTKFAKEGIEFAFPTRTIHIEK